LGAGLTIQPRKKVIVTKSHRGGGANWAVEPYDDDEKVYVTGLISKNIAKHYKLSRSISYYNFVTNVRYVYTRVLSIMLSRSLALILNDKLSVFILQTLNMHAPVICTYDDT
jgi:hypothetical protein